VDKHHRARVYICIQRFIFLYSGNLYIVYPYTLNSRKKSTRKHTVYTLVYIEEPRGIINFKWLPHKETDRERNSPAWNFVGVSKINKKSVEIYIVKESKCNDSLTHQIRYKETLLLCTVTFEPFIINNIMIKKIIYTK